MVTLRWRFTTARLLSALLLFCSLAMPEAAFSNSSNKGNPKLVATAKKYVGVKEKGHNRGKLIEQWQKKYGGKPGYPYCAYFVSAMLDESGSTVPKVRTGRSRSFFNSKSIRISHIAKGYAEVLPGWILIWANFRKGKMLKTGHVGINVRQLKGSIILFETIEANTRSENKGRQDEGDGVYERVRGITNKGNFRLIGVTISK